MHKIQIPKEKIVANNFSSGLWVPGSGAEKNVYSPYTGAIVGKFNESTSEDVQAIVQAAHEAQSAWGKTPLKERTQIMFKFRELLIKKAPEVSNIVALESGKTYAEAYAGVMKGLEVLEFALSLQNLDSGAKMEVSRGVHCEYRREPLGVVANITPFNFPAMVPMWTIPIVLTLGNSYIWKPSEKTPLTSVLLANCLKEAGVPNGIFSVIQGGKQSVEDIIDHPLVKAIGFVGSSKVAKSVYSRSTSLGKRALCLGGAKNHIILLPDADPEISGRGISDSFTGCAGQRCMAASVLLAVGDCDEQIKKIIERAQSLKIGQDMGAMITQEQVTFLDKAITQAQEAGAKILVDGRKQKVTGDYENGYWLGPTILDQVKPGSDAAKIELFGPIISIMRCANLSEALEIENSNDYGNACSVFTNSGSAAETVAQKAKAGMVGVNIGVPVPREPFSFGGINESKFGHGDITGEHSLNFWSNLKKITTKWEAQSDNNWMS
jgi:malonate-semialdehyde dehydrogenase (acetylating)/methylmalonate-semialdehyde dehydrogenase